MNDEINPYTGEPWGNATEERGARYQLGYDVGQIYGITSTFVRDGTLKTKSPEFRMGFWDAIGDRE